MIEGNAPVFVIYDPAVIVGLLTQGSYCTQLIDKQTVLYYLQNIRLLPVDVLQKHLVDGSRGVD